MAIAVCGACGNFFHQDTVVIDFGDRVAFCTFLIHCAVRGDLGIGIPAEQMLPLLWLQGPSSAVSVSKTKTPIIVGFLETAEIEVGKKRRNLITCTKARISRGPFAREM